MQINTPLLRARESAGRLTSVNSCDDECQFTTLDHSWQVLSMLSERQDRDLVRSVPLLAGLTPSVERPLLAHAITQTLPPGTRLFEQGDRATHLYAVLFGRVGLIARGEDRGEAVVEFFNAGDIVIAPAVILDLPYLLSGVVIDDSRILMLPADDVRHALDTDHRFARTMMRELAQHWRLLIRQMKDLKLRPANERLASYLVTLSGQKEGWHQLREDRRLLAQRLAMTPESLSRAFAALRPYGVSTEGRRVLIADMKALRQYCGFDPLF